jgi:D-sedoheptulose 7-phosphate isomerase
MAEHVESVETAGNIIAEAFNNGKRLFAFGNGGSSASASHFIAEFTGKLKLDRKSLAGVWIGGDVSALTAIGNDYGFDHIFSRPVSGLVGPGDVVVGLSTSGSSSNVVNALKLASELGAHTIFLTGRHSEVECEINIQVGSEDTPRIQETHDFLLHMIAQAAEAQLFPRLGASRFRDPFDFVITNEQLGDYSKWATSTNTKLVTTNGVFDLLHLGHRYSLESARKYGDQLVVLINSDASVSALKGSARPIRKIDERVNDLKSLPFVSHVAVFEGENPLAELAVLKPSVHVKGSEYSNIEIAEIELVKKFGTELVFLERMGDYSTSKQVATAGEDVPR